MRVCCDFAGIIYAKEVQCHTIKLKINKVYYSYLQKLSNIIGYILKHVWQIVNRFQYIYLLWCIYFDVINNYHNSSIKDYISK